MRRHSHHGFGLRLYFQGLNLHRIWMEKLHTHNSKDLCETKTGCSSAFLAKDSDFGLSVLAIFSDLAWAAEAGADLKLRNLSTSPPCVLVPPLPSPPPSFPPEECHNHNITCVPQFEDGTTAQVCSLLRSAGYYLAVRIFLSYKLTLSTICQLDNCTSTGAGGMSQSCRGL